MNIAKPVLAVIGGVLAAILILAVLWFGHWWVFAESVNRTGQIRQDSFEHQQGLITSAQQKLPEVSAIDVQLTSTTGDTHVALVNQRQALVNQICSQTAQITETMPADLASFNTKECR